MIHIGNAKDFVVDFRIENRSGRGGARFSAIHWQLLHHPKNIFIVKFSNGKTLTSSKSLSNPTRAHPTERNTCRAVKGAERLGELAPRHQSPSTTTTSAYGPSKTDLHRAAPSLEGMTHRVPPEPFPLVGSLFQSLLPD